MGIGGFSVKVGRNNIRGGLLYAHVEKRYFFEGMCLRELDAGASGIELLDELSVSLDTMVPSNEYIIDESKPAGWFEGNGHENLRL